MTPRTARHTRALIAIVTAGLVFTACATTDVDDEGTPSPSVEDTPTQPDPTTPESSETPSEPSDDPATEESIEPVGEFSTDEQQSESWPEYGQTSGVYPTAVRSALHDGFERIVIEHAGTGQPSFHAQYTDEPLEPGIGTPVDTGAGAYLEVTLSGTSNAYDDPPDMLDHGETIENLTTQATQSVVSFAPWEATSTYILGLDEQRPVAVTVLEEPVRLVIDVQLDEQ